MKQNEIAPAKINLWLRVLRKREDGFHDIESLMVAVSGVHDLLSFDVEEGEGEFDIFCDNSNLSLGIDNLIYKAIKVFEDGLSIKIKGSVKLEKNIPLGAGLGGGSSDAAATLNAMNKLFGLPFSNIELSDMAAALGSDVPFFIEGKPCLSTGRGEILAPYLGKLTNKPIVLVKPEFGVSSGWAYSNWGKSTKLPSVDYGDQRAEWGRVVNDLEVPVFEKFLFLPALKTWLLDKKETEVVLMSGSGSTIFAVCSNEISADRIINNVKLDFGEDIWCKIVHLVENS